MSIKRWLVAALAVVALFLCFFLYLKANRTVSSAGSPPGVLANSEGSNPAQSGATLVHARTDDHGVASPTGVQATSDSSAQAAADASSGNVDSSGDKPQLPPEIVMENMRKTFHLYASEFGGNPVGTNREITRSLNGGNRKQIVFIPPDAGLRISEKGELVDSWGTPFFFHQLSGTQMEIHSAGPDRIMWTPDDIVLK